jgi:hypothetical protein
MKYASRLTLLAIVLSLSFTVRADDQQKAQKQVNKITAMAADLTGRRAVNQSMADQFGVKRADLVRERREHNWNYGSLFVIHQLMGSGAKLDDIAERLKAGKNLYDIANEFHADWKQIGVDAKKLNSKIEDNLYTFFLSKKSVDKPDVYDPLPDAVTADMAVSQQDLDEAQQRYSFWKNRASVKQEGSLAHNKEQAARQSIDPVRKGGPQADQVGNMGPSVSTTPH